MMMNSKTRLTRSLVTSALAGGALLLAAEGFAQAPAAFRTTPANAQLLLRVDFGAIESNASLAPLLQKIREDQPNFPQSIIAELDESGSYSFLAEDFPGEIRIFEVAFYDLEEGQVPNGYITAYGNYDKDALTTKFSENGWTEATVGELTYWTNEDEEAVLIPNDYTILMADSAAGLQSMFNAAASDASVRTGNADLSSSVATADRSLLFVAAALRDSDRAELRQQIAQVQQDPNAAMMMAMMPGAMPLMNEAAQMRSLVFTFDSGDSGLRGNFGVNLPGEENATNFANAMNQTIPMAAQMGAMFAQGDPESTRMLQQFGQLRMATSGNRAYLSFPVADSLIQQMIEGMGQADVNALRGAASRSAW